MNRLGRLEEPEIFTKSALHNHRFNAFAWVALVGKRGQMNILIYLHQIPTIP